MIFTIIRLAIITAVTFVLAFKRVPLDQATNYRSDALSALRKM
jgi:hypothetical protein